MPKTEKKQYWLFKSEPSAFSIKDLEKAPQKTTCWSGVRNYQARNFLRDQVAVGDYVYFYHSGTEQPATVGIAEVVKAGYPDHTAFDSKDDHFDPKSKKSEPTWFMVDIKHIKTFAQPLPLEQLRKTKGLENMVLLQKGARLSIQPVTEKEWNIIQALTEQYAKSR